jgi:Abnormal spindle-like microcephaly-assoc'd, ASPM-SPD-2-Hydin
MRKGNLLALTCVATVLLAGCSLAPAPKASLSSPALTVSSSTISFGNVAVGGKKTASLVVTNPADSGNSVTVSQVSITGSGFKLSSPPTLPATVGAGQSVTVKVMFSPAASGSASGALTISSDATNSGISVALAGDGSSAATGQLSLSPASMAFGSVAVGSSASKTGTLTASNADVTVSTVDESGSGYSLSGITFPVTITAGHSISFSVSFAPQSAGSSPGTLAFINDASDPTSDTLSGTGTSQSSSHTVSLSWSPSASSVVGYNIYRGTVSGGPYPTKLTSAPQADTSYVDSSVQSSATYFYVATAVDSDMAESGYSNQAKAVIP